MRKMLLLGILVAFVAVGCCSKAKTCSTKTGAESDLNKSSMKGSHKGS